MLIPPTIRKTTTWMRRIGDGARDLLFPPKCIACSMDLKHQPGCDSFCSTCYQKLPLVNWPTCRCCAARVPEIPGVVETCIRCETNGHAFDRTLALGSYDGLLRDLILRMKTDRSEMVAAILSKLILDRMEKSFRALAFDVIVPIPMATSRRLVRGTNPPAAIAEILSRSFPSAPCLQLLTKSRNASPQRGLSQAGRLRNMQGQIGIRNGYQLRSPHILLVDDTMTTGATCGEAAKVLKRQGAPRVSVFVVGRTPQGSKPVL